MSRLVKFGLGSCRTRFGYLALILTMLALSSCERDLSQGSIHDMEPTHLDAVIGHLKSYKDVVLIESSVSMTELFTLIEQFQMGSTPPELKARVKFTLKNGRKISVDVPWVDAGSYLIIVCGEKSNGEPVVAIFKLTERKVS